MLSILGRSHSACDGVSRRQVLRAAGGGLLGLSLPKLLSAEAAAASTEARPRARSVIFMFLFGGPSQLETFDLKPDAPEKIRGPFKPIASRTSGLRICEHLPRLAAISDKFCVVRSMTHEYNDHSGGGHYIQTGRKWQIPIGGGFDATPKDWPSHGSVVEYLDQHAPGGIRRELPSYMVLPNWLGRLEQAGQYRRPGQYAGWLGRAYDPLNTAIDKRNLQDNPYWRDCTDQELTFQIEGLVRPQEVRLERIAGRVSLLEQFDQQRRLLDGRGTPEPVGRISNPSDKGGQVGAREAAFDRFRQRALGLVMSEKTRRALDIRQEPAAMRDRYGRHLLGQATLMARRLVESGARFVTVHYDACDGYSWDSHLHSNDVQKHLVPTFDQALAALLGDLDERGLLKETLVVALGEMGRTPIANPTWGRGHWSTLFPAVLAGAGIRGGTLYGGSDKDAALPIDHPTSPEDLAATIYQALGIDHDLRLPDPLGRPVAIVEGGRPVMEIFG